MRGAAFFTPWILGWPWDLLTYKNMREDSGPSLNPNVKKKDMFLLTPFVFLPFSIEHAADPRRDEDTFNRSYVCNPLE